MPKFGENSKKNLNTTHWLLQQLFNRVVQTYDCSVVCGYRGEKEQTQAYKIGASKIEFPNSEHNQNPSLAVDVIPYPEGYKDIFKFYHFVGYVKAIAEEMDIPVISGVDWDGDENLSEHPFQDLPHWQLILGD